MGFNPTTEFCEAGERIDPLVSDPIAATAKLAATATPLPLLEPELIKGLSNVTTKGRRFGIFPAFRENPLYVNAITVLEKEGAILVDLPEKQVQLNGFIKLLNADMKIDLPKYFQEESNVRFERWNVATVMQENRKDSINAMPYGQKLFQGIMDEPDMTPQEFSAFKKNLTQNAQDYLNGYYQEFDLDGILSINNYTAGVAAVGFFPAMTVPMGYDKEGMPYGLTFIAPTGKDKELFGWAAAYEKVSMKRQIPENYDH